MTESLWFKIIPDDKNDFIKFLITDMEWRALLTMSIVRLEILSVRREQPERGRAGSGPGRGWEGRSSCPE